MRTCARAHVLSLAHAAAHVYCSLVINTASIGWAAGRDRGLKEGEQRGFSACQAGFRALLGAASPADVTTFLKAAERAGT